MDVGLALIVCFLMASMTDVQSQIQKGPVNSLNKTGDSVTLECVTVNRNCDQVDWAKVDGQQSSKQIYKHGSGMVNNDTYPTQRYSVNSTGGCNLTITQLEVNDSGIFICTQAVGDKEKESRSILVVISVVTGSCASNSSALDKDDGYSLWCAINVPANTVEPSNVTLVLPTEAAGEINATTNGTQPRTTLNGTATKENITQRVCRASFPPKKEPNYDDTTATLDICTTTKLIVSYPVENVAVSPPSGHYYKGITVRCTADGYPPPTFNWTNLQSGKVVNGRALKIHGEVGDNYTCTATNTFKGTAVSKNRTIEVSSPPACGIVCIHHAAAGGVALVVAGVVAAVVVKNKKDKNGERASLLHSNPVPAPRASEAPQDV